MATSAMMEPTERSMPPVISTTVMPSAMMPKGAKLREMLPRFSAEPKVGSTQLITSMRASSATATQKDWARNSFCSGVCSRTPTTSSRVAWFAATGSDSADVARLGCTYRSRNQSGDLFRRRRRYGLVRHLGAAAHDDDAIANGEHIRHAMADQHD